jgi:CRISPR-associated protein Csd1
MILQSLYKDANAIMTQTGLGVMPPSMYIPKLLRWVVDISTEPTIPVQFSPQTVTDVKGKERGIQHLLPDVKRTVGVTPFLLADTPSYTLGLVFESDLKGKDETRERSRAAQKHLEFKALVRRCAELTEDPDVAVISRFLDTWDPNNLPPNFPKDMDGSQAVTFRVDRHRLVIEDPQVRAFWAAHVAGDDVGVENRPPMQCLVSGVRGPVEKMMPVPVKGIPGGQPTGTHLVSANFNAVESYGLERAQTSPISREAGERFGKALNALLASDRHHLTVQNMVYVYWAAPGTPKLLPFALSPSTEEVSKLFEAVHKGQAWCSIPNEAKFHIFGLSANAARAVVRAEIDTTIGEVGRAQADWFERLRIIGTDGQTGDPLGLKTLAVASYREFKDIPTGVEDALVQAALNRVPLPESLLQAVVMRCRLGTKAGERVTHVTYARAALLKYILTQKRPDMEEANAMQEEITGALPPGHNAAAYHCGRLFAELEDIQSASSDYNINATISDKYFGSASSSPASVFGILMAGVQNHLSKLRKGDERHQSAFRGAQKRLEEILSEIGDFPLTLPLRDQALFSLGYYHHRAAKRKDIALRSEAKKRASTITLDGSEQGEN